ncbi:hypothetical protein [Siminovitchia fortis]|nr:hypothetical protein [Siminovitchia fortis]
MKWYSIGTLSFPAFWAAVAAAFVSVYVYLRLQRKKQAADLYEQLAEGPAFQCRDECQRHRFKKR